MSSDALAELVEKYDHLFASEKYEEAAKLGGTILWELYVDGQVAKVSEILGNTINTTSNPVTMSSAWLNLGDVLYDKNLFDKARASYLQGLEVAGSKDSILKARFLYGIANTYFMQGDYTEAKIYYENSLTLSKESGMKSAIADNLLQLSEIARTIGEYDDAEKFGRMSLEINSREKRRHASLRSAQSLSNLAIQFEATGHRDRAKELLLFCLSALQLSENESALDMVRSVLAGFPE